MRNMSGFNRFYFLPKDEVINIPKALNNTISDAIITANDWYEGYFSFETEDFKYSEKDTQNGKVYSLSLKGKLPKLSPAAENLFFDKRNREFVLLVFDNNNQGRLCGNTSKAMRFTFSTNNANDGYTFEYFGTFGATQPFYTGAYNSYVPPSPYADLPIKYHYYQPSGYTTIVNNTDYAWQEANIFKPARLIQPIQAIPPVLDDFFTLHSSTPNVFGNTSRFTDALGNPLPATNPVGTYVVDNYTGLGWVALADTSELRFPDYEAVATASNSNGYSDWLIPSIPTSETIINYADGTINHLGYTYINFIMSTYFPLYSLYFATSSTFVRGFESGNTGFVVMFRKHF